MNLFSDRELKAFISMRSAGATFLIKTQSSVPGTRISGLFWVSVKIVDSVCKLGKDHVLRVRPTPFGCKADPWAQFGFHSDRDTKESD